MDSLHFYLFHLVEGGCRLSNKNALNQGNDTEISSFDATFSTLISIIDSDDTFLDAVCFDVADELNVDSLFDLLEDIFEGNEYDTDSLDLDVKIFESDGKSNISSLVNNSQIMRKIEEIFLENKSYVGHTYIYNTCCTVVVEICS